MPPLPLICRADTMLRFDTLDAMPRCRCCHYFDAMPLMLRHATCFSPTLMPRCFIFAATRYFSRHATPCLRCCIITFCYGALLLFDDAIYLCVFALRLATRHAAIISFARLLLYACMMRRHAPYECRRDKHAERCCHVIFVPPIPALRALPRCCYYFA